MLLSKAERKQREVRRRYAEASLACEGIFLTQEEKRLFEEMDAEGLSDEQCRRRIVAYLDEVSAPQPIAAE